MSLPAGWQNPIVDAMTCPPKIAVVILEILYVGLVGIRVLGWAGDSASCASEADLYRESRPNRWRRYHALSDSRKPEFYYRG